MAKKLKKEKVSLDIVSFYLVVGSPITADEKALIKMAKKLKKENVSLDIGSLDIVVGSPLMADEKELIKMARKLKINRCFSLAVF